MIQLPEIDLPENVSFRIWNSDYQPYEQVWLRHTDYESLRVTETGDMDDLLWYTDPLKVLNVLFELGRAVGRREPR